MLRSNRLVCNLYEEKINKSLIMSKFMVNLVTSSDFDPVPKG